MSVTKLNKNFISNEGIQQLEEGEIIENNNKEYDVNNNPSKQDIINEECFDLDTGLLKLGWRKFYSERVKRHYFYNKVNSVSVWSMKDVLKISGYRSTSHNQSTTSSCSSPSMSSFSLPSQSPVPCISPASIMSSCRLSQESCSDRTKLFSLQSSPTLSNSYQSPTNNYGSGGGANDDIFFNNTDSLASLNENARLLLSNNEKNYNRKISFSSDEYEDRDDDLQQRCKKRKLNEDEYSNKWNLLIKSNVVTYERPMSLMLPPHPDIEIKRVDFYVEHLRKALINIFNAHFISFFSNENDEQVMSEEDEDLVNDLFTYWIVETKLLKLCERTKEAFFLDEEEDVKMEDNSFFITELVNSVLMNDLNTKIKEAFGNADINKMEIYKNCIKMVEDKMMKSNKESDTRETTDEESELDCQYFEKKLNKLMDEYKRELFDVAKEAFEKNELIELNNNLCESIYRKHRMIYDAEDKINIFAEPPEYKSDRKIMCYPWLMCTPSPLLPNVRFERDHLDKNLFHLIHKNRGVCLRNGYYKKLSKLYDINCKDDSKKVLFLPRLFCLLKRYEFITNSSLSSPRSVNRYLFYTLNHNLISYLKEKLNISFELFSNPFTSYFSQFCSYFADIDSYFGSRGSPFNFNTLAGSFLATMPFSEKLIDNFLAKIQKSLDLCSTECLSFVVVLPLVRNSSYYIKKITNSIYVQSHIILERNKHTFRSLNEYKEEKESNEFSSAYDTLIAIFQNETAKQMYPIDESELETIRSF